MQKRLLSIDARMLFMGGIGTYIQNLLQRIPFKKLGLALEIYFRTPQEAEWLKKNVPEATLKHCPWKIYGPSEQLFWLKNIKGGAFWAPNYNFPWWGYERLLVTVHEGGLPLSPYGRLLPKMYATLMFAIMRRKADAILSVCEFGEERLREVAGIDETPIYFTPLAVDPSWLTPPSAPSPFPFRYIVYVGNIKPHKNLTRLLEAYGKLAPLQKLVCVGSFKNLKLRDENAYRLMKKMEGRVIFTDEIVGEELRNIVKNSEGLVSPSLFEGFNLTPLEGMASRIPVLVSRIRGMKDTCGEGALYCNPHSVNGLADGLKRLLTLSSEEKQNMLERGLKRVSQLDWQKTADLTFEVFQKYFK